MNPERRKFLKDAVRMGGVTALYMLGGDALVKEALAETIFIPGHLGSGSVSWADWDESSESSLGNDDYYVCVSEGVNAGDNETGQDGDTVTGVDLVLTQVGNIPGVSGGTRQLDGTSQHFTMTGNLRDQMIKAKSAWAIMWRVDTWETIAQYDAMIRWEPDGNNHMMFRASAAGGPVTFILRHNTTTHFSATSTDSPNTTLRHYGVICCDGANILMGWVEGATKPTKLSDFSVNKRATAVAACNLSSFTFNDGDLIFNDTISNTRWAKVKFKWLIFASVCPLDLTS